MRFSLVSLLAILGVVCLRSKPAIADVGGQTAKLLPSDVATNYQFGLSAAISGTTAIVGAFRDDDNGADSGSAYLFDTPILAASTTRNGSGLNASILSRVTYPVLGSNFITNLDCTGHSPSSAFLKFYMGASSGIFLPGGELLLDLASPRLLSVSQAHADGVIQLLDRRTQRPLALRHDSFYPRNCVWRAQLRAFERTRHCRWELTLLYREANSLATHTLPTWV